MVQEINGEITLQKKKQTDKLNTRPVADATAEVVRCSKEDTYEPEMPGP